MPYLLSHFGLHTSDDAIPALMGKHISEGKLPPIYYYGQLYMGSVLGHFFALMILIFGYSNFLLKFSALLLFLAFVSIQFLLLKETFSLNFALVVSFFYCLPVGYLVDLSLESRWAYSLVFLLGSALLYLSYLINYKDRLNLIPWAGFLMGISFWAHQISVCFILTSLVFIALKIKIQLKRYFALVFFFFLGALPVLMAEIYHEFPLMKFLAPGKATDWSWAKVTGTAKMVLSLMSLENRAYGYFALFFILFGFFTLLFFSIQKKKLMPYNIYTLFFLIFCLMYVFSGFSSRGLIRYLHPMYFCLPVLLLSGFLIIKSKIKYFFMGTLIVALFFFYNSKESVADYLRAKELHSHLIQVITSMKATGKRYWRGEYWTAYQLTSLSGEKIIVDSYTNNRYFPYNLMYENEAQEDNFVFLESSPPPKFLDLLNSLKIGYKSEKIGGSWLIYDLKEPVPRRIFLFPVPIQIPEIELTPIKIADGFLHVTYKKAKAIEGPGGFRIHFEIPGFSSLVKILPGAGENVTHTVPFPNQGAFGLISYLDFRGLKIPSTIQTIPVSLPSKELEQRKPNVVFLSGLGPEIEVKNEKLKVCEKEARLEINSKLEGKSKIRLHVFSPMEFSHPYWYGDYFQEVEISINDRLHSNWRLQYEKNVIDLEIESFDLKERSNILALKFKYHLFFSFAPGWKTAVLLGKVELE
ncbi:hypothetical protein ACFLRM_05735 [Acidobacteriota bacterium]